MSDSSREPVYVEPGWFQDFGRGPELTGTRCLDCDRVFFPPKRVCPQCFDGRIKPAPLSRKGTLHTFAQAVMGPKELQRPYVMGFVDLPEGIKLYSLLVDCDPWDQVLKVGLPVEMVIEPFKKDEEGRDVLCYKFRPAREDD